MYIPLENRRLENTALIAIICTILISSPFRIHEIEENERLNFNNTSPTDILKKWILKNANKIIIGHLNINSIRNKIEDLKSIFSQKIKIYF